jgi:predicted amidohydrolase
MKIALFQIDCVWENKQANFDKVRSLMPRVRGKGVDLVCLPECFATGYTMNPVPYAEGIKGETCVFLSGLARAEGMAVIGSFIEKTEGRPRNSVVVFDKKGERIAHYSKIFLFSYAGEDKHYERGDELAVFNLMGASWGLAVCYDLRFPELFRAYVDRGVNGVFVSANWPAERSAHWEVLLRARSLDNQIYVIGVNRVGVSPQAEYRGRSMAIGPSGERAGGPPCDREEVIIVDVDAVYVEKTRKTFPTLADWVRNRRLVS